MRRRTACRRQRSGRIDQSEQPYLLRLTRVQADEAERDEQVRDRSDDVRRHPERIERVLRGLARRMREVMDRQKDSPEHQRHRTPADRVDGRPVSYKCDRSPSFRSDAMRDSREGQVISQNTQLYAVPFTAGPSRELHGLPRLYRAATLKCDNSGRLLPRPGSRRGSRKRGTQARGSGNSSARSGRAWVAPVKSNETARS